MATSSIPQPNRLHRLREFWESLMARRWLLPVVIGLGFVLSLAIHQLNLNAYYQLILIYICINVILTVSLNLVNGYMGEFSVGHAGFMAVGAYVGALLSTRLWPVELNAWLFPVTVIIAGLVTALFGLIVAIPSFKTRGDYLAIVTLAFLFIVKSAIENIELIGGPRGIPGIYKLSNLPWSYVWMVIALWVTRNFVYSNFGRGVLSIREDEIASDLMSVRTRQVKLLAFVLSSFFAGVAGALFAHALQFISPRVFDIVKSTDILIMVYLGGIGSIGGSILGAAVFTVLLEALRGILAFFGLPQSYRYVIMPLVLILLMIYRPRGIMGLREFRWFIPGRDLFASQRWRSKANAKKEAADAAPM
jgi:branched-chain amino acid transport system permease protein